TAVRQQHDQPVGCKPDQGLAHGRTGNPESLLKARFIEIAARRQPQGDDVLAYLSVDALHAGPLRAANAPLRGSACGIRRRRFLAGSRWPRRPSAPCIARSARLATACHDIAPDIDASVTESRQCLKV